MKKEDCKLQLQRYKLHIAAKKWCRLWRDNHPDIYCYEQKDPDFDCPLYAKTLPGDDFDPAGWIKPGDSCYECGQYQDLLCRIGAIDDLVYDDETYHVYLDLMSFTEEDVEQIWDEFIKEAEET